jgi:hypothetical protein
VIDNFVALYQPNDKTADLVSGYLLQLLMKLSKMQMPKLSPKSNAEGKLMQEGLRNVMTICLCSLVLGDESLGLLLTNFAESVGMRNLLEGMLMMDDSKKPLKIKKKNRSVVVRWMDANVPVECLNARVFEVMDKIENGGVLGTGTLATQGKIGGKYHSGALVQREGQPGVDHRQKSPSL